MPNKSRKPLSAVWSTVGSKLTPSAEEPRLSDAGPVRLVAEVPNRDLKAPARPLVAGAVRRPLVDACAPGPAQRSVGAHQLGHEDVLGRLPVDGEHRRALVAPRAGLEAADHLVVPPQPCLARGVDASADSEDRDRDRGAAARTSLGGRDDSPDVPPLEHRDGEGELRGRTLGGGGWDSR